MLPRPYLTKRQAGQYAAHALDCIGANSIHRARWADAWAKRGGLIYGQRIYPVTELAGPAVVYARAFDDLRTPQQILLWRKIEEKIRLWHKGRLIPRYDPKIISFPKRHL